MFKNQSASAVVGSQHRRWDVNSFFNCTFEDLFFSLAKCFNQKAIEEKSNQKKSRKVQIFQVS